MEQRYHKAVAEENDAHTALVSGATGAIGKAIARQLAAIGDQTVVLVCRDEQKGQDAVRQIRETTGNSQVYYELADLSRKASIAALADRWPGRLDVLVNNAASTPRGRQETAEGIELQLATNVLGYLWMTEAFRAQLEMAAPARVINVASYWAGDLDLNDLQFKRRRYDNNTAYRQSKQADRMLTAALADRFDPTRVTVNACHPGDVNSALSNDLGFGGHESPDAGARTPVWLATDPAVAGVTGKYFERMSQVNDRFTADRTAVESLYEACQRY